MTHSRMLDRNPSVQIMSNRNELKIYQNNIVYLNNGDNFELRFFNPLSEKIGVEVCFNGTKKGDALLVLNPGQDIVLDRFLDEQRKMLFDTYHIDGNNKQAVEAIEENGLITFNFFKEIYSYSRDTEVDVKYDFPPKPHKYDNNYGITKGITYSGDINSTITLDSFSDMTTSNVFMSQSLGNSSNSSNTSSFDSNSLDISNELETGRVEKGKHSNQTFKDVNIQFQESAFYTVEYQIMPHSAKHREATEIRQYCSECGYRLRKQTWRFCPKCGQKIQ